MSNIIQIKRGEGRPDGKLAPYELGIDTKNYELFVGGPLVNEDGIQKYGAALGIKVATAATAATATTATTATTASGLDDTGIAQVKGIEITNAINAANATSAEKANQLTNAQNIQINLASTSAVSFDGTSAVSPGVTGTLPIGNGGTGLTSNPSMLINLGSGNAANVLATSPRPGVTGTLSIKNGGTGLTASPSMLVNLGSTTAANILTDSPRPGVTGTLPIARGGTGATNEAAARASLGTNMVLLWTNPKPEKVFAAQDISLQNSSNYDAYIIVSHISKNTTPYAFLPISIGYKNYAGFITGLPNNKICRRKFTINSAGTTFTFNAAEYGNTYGGDGANNDYLIPLYIYGVYLVN